MNYMSLNEAARLNDLFAELRWVRYGLHAFPTRKPHEVALQYNSDTLGKTRTVICDPLRLDAWIRKNIATYGVYAKLIDMLDRKPDAPTSAEQPTLFPTTELAPVVKRSMNPNEQ